MVPQTVERLVSSVVAGELWDRVDPAAPFLLGAATGLASAVLVFMLLRTPAGAAVNSD